MSTSPSPHRSIATLVALALVVLAGAALPAAAPAKAKPKCPSAGKVLVKSSQARVYQVTVKGETRTYGCWLPTGDRLRLDERCDPDDGSPEGDDACSDAPDIWALNGKYVALATDSLYYGESGNTYTKIVRGKLGPKPKAEELGRINNRQGTELGPFVEKLFVSKRGAIAFSASDVEEGTNLIGSVSRGGKQSDLDTGDDVAVKSLAVSGAVITWLQGGTPKSAPFS